MRNNIPVISFVGYSDSGKTTFIEKLIRQLEQQGVECAYIKHTHHDDVIGEITDESSKDSAKMIRAGAKISSVVNDDQIVVLQRSRPDIERLISYIEGVDIIIIEGYKKKQFPKIMVTNSADPNEWPALIDGCLAVVSDVIEYASKPVFRRDDIDSFIEWMMINIIRRG